MKTTVKANGRLYHHFHGTYSADIGLLFPSEQAATAVQSTLLPDWEIGEKCAKVLVWSGGSDTLDACVAVLESFGADPRKVTSLAKSVDCGEDFTCTFTFEQPADPNQLALF